MGLVIETFGLTRFFESLKAVGDLDLKIEEGHIHGFLGRNGAGKTTVVKMLMGLLQPSRGEVMVFGEDPWIFKPETKMRIGFLPEEHILIDWFSVQDMIKFHAGFYPKWNDSLADELIRVFDINKKARVGRLSKGQKRSLHILLLLSQMPDILILDEPAAGLDTVMRRLFLDKLLEFVREEGKTVFFSSHILPDVERVADWIGIIEKGSLLVSNETDVLKDRTRRIIIEKDALTPEMTDKFDVLSRNEIENTVVFTISNYSDDLNIILQDAKVETLGLEDIFIAYTMREICNV